MNPATEEVVGKAPNATVADAEAAAAAARRRPAGMGGHRTGGARRPHGAAPPQAISARAEELLPLVIAETGATAAVGSSLQVPIAAEPLRALLAATSGPWPSAPCRPQVARGHPPGPGRAHQRAWPLRQPVGVVACITSYNFPLVNMAGKVAPALAMGNTVVVKPAAQDPLAVVELVRILEEVGFPPGVVNLVNSADAGAGGAHWSTRPTWT